MNLRVGPGPKQRGIPKLKALTWLNLTEFKPGETGKMGRKREKGPTVKRTETADISLSPLKKGEIKSETSRLQRTVEVRLVLSS